MNNHEKIEMLDQDLNVDVRPPHNFVGLKNLGCTCYINSLLQQFYMIKDFKNSIINAEIVILESNADKNDNNIDNGSGSGSNNE